MEKKGDCDYVYLETMYKESNIFHVYNFKY